VILQGGVLVTQPLLLLGMCHSGIVCLFVCLLSQNSLTSLFFVCDVLQDLRHEIEMITCQIVGDKCVKGQCVHVCVY
jgi:hypothetical protein